MFLSFVPGNAMDVDMGPSPRRARSPFIANKIAARKIEFIDQLLISCCCR